MTAMPMGQTDSFESVEESIKIERNSRGVNHSFRLKRVEGESFEDWVARCGRLDRMLVAEFGTKD